MAFEYLYVPKLLRRQEQRELTHRSLLKSLNPVEEAKALVIPKQENSSWRDQILAKRKKPTLIPGPGSLSAPMEIIEEPAKEIQHGLQLTKRIKIDHPIQDNDMEPIASSEVAVEDDAADEQKEETLDEVAARKIIEGMLTAAPSPLYYAAQANNLDCFSSFHSCFWRKIGACKETSSFRTGECPSRGCRSFSKKPG